MNEIAIKQHSFEIAKNRLKEFSEKTETKLTLDTVDTDGFFPFSDHRVTGQELNTRLANIQDHFATINETNNKIIREFREVYNALDVLDKDYITSIIANVKAIEKTSNDVRIQQNILKQHNEKLENQQNKLDIHQVEINKSVESISKIVNALKIFKDKLEEYRHLNDIDQIWRDIENHSSMLAENKRKEEQFLINLKTIEITNNDIRKQQDTLKKENEKLEKYYIKLDTHQSETDKNITILKTFKDKLDKYEHLNDIDQIWKDIKNFSSILNESKKREEQFFINLKAIKEINDNIIIQHNELIKEHNELTKQLSEIDKNMENVSKNIIILKSFKDKLDKYKHLNDIDQIWKDIENHSSTLDESKKRDEILLSIIQKNKIEVNKYIIDITQRTNDTLLSLTKKVKYTYWLTGSAIGLAIFELILLLKR
jgi:hypothetical protein